MFMPLLSTKLSVKPPRADFVPRPHLVKKLNQGATQKLTLICAPAGFGEYIPPRVGKDCFMFVP